MKQSITVNIEPFNEKWCGSCSQLVTWRFGTQFACRLFSYSIGGRKGLKYDTDGSIMRHKKCIDTDGSIMRHKKCIDNGRF